MRGDVEAGYVDGKLRASLPANISLDGQNGGYQRREQTGSVRSRASPLRTSPPSASGEPQSKNNPLHHDVDCSSIACDFALQRSVSLTGQYNARGNFQPFPCSASTRIRARQGRWSSEA
jgi:hypothetical protein